MAEINLLRRVNIAQPVVFKGSNKRTLSIRVREQKKSCIWENTATVGVEHSTHHLPTCFPFPIRTVTVHAVPSLVMTIGGAMHTGPTILTPAMLARIDHHGHRSASGHNE